MITGQESEYNSCSALIAACLEEVAVKCLFYGAPSDMALATKQIEDIMKELSLLIQKDCYYSKWTVTLQNDVVLWLNE